MNNDIYKFGLMINYRIFFHIKKEIEFNTNTILWDLNKKIKETNYKKKKN